MARKKKLGSKMLAILLSTVVACSSAGILVYAESVTTASDTESTSSSTDPASSAADETSGESADTSSTPVDTSDDGETTSGDVGNTSGDGANTSGDVGNTSGDGATTSTDTGTEQGDTSGTETELGEEGEEVVEVIVDDPLLSAPNQSSGTVDDIYSQYDFCITFSTPGVYFTENRENASYPRIAYAKDVSIVCEINGEEYYGRLIRIGDGIRTFGFVYSDGEEDVELSEPSGTLTIENQLEDVEYRVNGKKTIELESLSWTNPLISINEDDPRWEREYAIAEEDVRSEADESGWLSITATNTFVAVATLELSTELGAGFSIYDGSYGTIPNFIGGAALYDGDTQVAEGIVSDGYVVMFDTSDLDNDKTYTLKVLYFVNGNKAVRYGTMSWKPTINSSPKTEYHLMSEFEWESANTVAELELSDIDNPDGEEDKIIWDNEEGLYESEFRIAVHSELSKYDTTVSGIDTFVSLSGKATEGFLENNNRLGAELGDTVVWERFNVNKTAGIRASVEAGTYKLSGSDQLNLTYSGDFKIGSEEKKDIELKVSPKYTLNITSKAGKIDCSVDGYSFSDTDSQDLALVCDTEYIVTDNVSGKIYCVKATDDNAHIELVLGENEYLIADGGINTFVDEVPKTADPIVVITIVFCSLLLAFGVSFFFVYRANKKKGDA